MKIRTTIGLKSNNTTSSKKVNKMHITLEINK